MGLASNLLEMNPKIFFVILSAVINLLLAFVVHCGYGFFASLDGCMLPAIREDCLNHKLFSISGRLLFLAVAFLLGFL